MPWDWRASENLRSDRWIAFTACCKIPNANVERVRRLFASVRLVSLRIHLVAYCFTLHFTVLATSYCTFNNKFVWSRICNWRKADDYMGDPFCLLLSCAPRWTPPVHKWIRFHRKIDTSSNNISIIQKLIRKMVSRPVTGMEELNVWSLQKQKQNLFFIVHLGDVI